MSHDGEHDHGPATAVDLEAEAARGLRGLGGLLLVVGALCLSGGTWLLLRAPTPTAQDLVERAAAELSEGRAELALHSAERAVQAAPERADAWLLRGRALRSLGRRADARASLERAGQLQPDRWEAQVELAWVCHELGDSDRARAALEAARGLAPDEAAVQGLARALGR